MASGYVVGSKLKSAPDAHRLERAAAHAVAAAKDSTSDVDIAWAILPLVLAPGMVDCAACPQRAATTFARADPPPHTHTRRHTHMHACTRASMYAHMHANLHACAHPQTHFALSGHLATSPLHSYAKTTSLKRRC